jgi:hypothetical protein
MDQKIDLTAEGLIADETQASSEATPPEQLTDEQFIEQLSLFLTKVESSMSGLHLVTKTLASRISTLESFVAYLIEKDPELSEKVKEAKRISEAMAAATAAATGPVDAQEQK